MTEEREQQARELWRGETYRRIEEARNPGSDEYAKGYNNGLRDARKLIFAALSQTTPLALPAAKE